MQCTHEELPGSFPPEVTASFPLPSAAPPSNSLPDSSSPLSQASRVNSFSSRRKTTVGSSAPAPIAAHPPCEKPTESSLKEKADALWQAIVQEQPQKGMLFFFPLSAYEQVKAVSNPKADWKYRLISNYNRDIHELHQRFSTQSPHARFVRLEVLQGSMRWVNPEKEWNKLGYCQILGARLHYQLTEGASTKRPIMIPVRSLIAWKGEWFIVHLNRFK
ncbi:hypothetical protein BCY86_03910 [Pajaroellobacter abortibovis]|uniref:Uncharacterized protein n=2 Tax=Pajaroellobacter abortibovis TaxID=1882918 RepID=A0A1L6MWX0_9BACT|nr:hypothetical protein BCY86_03910 [Pajaroellobacter abortibovis]